MRVAALVALLPCLVAAQGPLFAEVGEPLPDGMGQLIAAADFEGDGDDDLFTTVGVFLNDGGFFRPGPVMPASFDASFNIRAVVVADFTGDGRVDVLVGRLGGTPPGLVLYTAPAAGGAAFVAGASAIAGASNLYELAAADVDNDGDVDVIGGNSSTATPAWELLLNDGTGAFALATSSQWGGLFPTSAPTWIGTGDFDGDGWIDVAAILNGSGVSWRRNAGNGSFPQSQPLSFVALGLELGVVGDFDGNGFDDLVVVSNNGNEAWNPGSAAGLSNSGFWGGAGIHGAPPIAADVDGDGDDDMLLSLVEVSGGTAGELFLRPGGSLFGPPLNAPLGAVRFAYGSPTPYPGVAVLDADGDGDRDIVVAPGANAPWLLVDGGGFGPMLAPSRPPLGYRQLFAPPSDVDGDGDVDLVRAEIASGVVTLEVHRNDGRGGFRGPHVPAGSFPALAVTRGHWADLDGDGDNDLWVEGFPGQASVALLNDGAGFFSVGALVANTDAATAIGFGDFDGDQILDVVQGRPATGSFPPMPRQPLFIRGLPAPGGVAYAAPVTFGNAEIVTDIAVFDLGADGDLDLLVGTRAQLAGSGAPHLYENDGTGTLTALPPFPGVLASVVAVGDVDNDSCEDLVLATETWLCQGSTFVPSSVHAAPLGKIALADVDADGDLDLVDSGGAWYEGDGTGGFSPPTALAPYGATMPSAGGGAMPVDLDSDGDLDMIGPASRTPGHFAFYSNLIRHAAPTTLAKASRPLGLSVFGQVGEPWFLVASLPASGPIVRPPFGTLFVDPSSAVVVGFGAVPTAGRADLGVPIPANGTGFTLTWQAFVGPQLRLTNAFDTPILP